MNNQQAVLTTRDGARVPLQTRQTRLAAVPVFVIGSDPRCDLVLNDPRIYPIHVLIARSEQGDWYLKTHAAAETISVDGEQVNKARLVPDSVLRVGGTVLRFELEQPDTALSALGLSFDDDDNALPYNAALADTPQVILPPRSRGDAAKSAFGTGMYVLALGCVVGFFVLFLISLASERATGSSTFAAPDTQFVGEDGAATVLYFHAEWCSVCRRQDPTMEVLTREYDGVINIYWVDTDDRANYGLVSRYNVDSIPRTVVLNAEGRVVRTFYGLASDRDLRSAMSMAMAG